MTVKETNKLINKILSKGAVEAGIFISMLVHAYIYACDIEDKDFLESLKNSLKILRENENEDVEKKEK